MAQPRRRKVISARREISSREWFRAALFIATLSGVLACSLADNKTTVERRITDVDREAQLTILPNIVFLIADDLGWVDVSTDLPNQGNGSEFYQTPNIDRLADQGISFTQAYALQNCQPTRAALFSGQYAPVNGVYNVTSLDRGDDPVSAIVPPPQRRSLDPAGISIAEMLKTAGYSTAFFGKNHGTGPDAALGANHGVDFNRAVRRVTSGTVGGAAAQSSCRALKDDARGWIFSTPGFTPYARPYDEHYIATVLEPIANGNDPNELLNDAKHLVDAIGDGAVDYIRTHAGEPQPFFLYVAFHAVHTRIAPRGDLLKKYQGIASLDPRHSDRSTRLS